MKHQVLSADALSKFVVIASASRGTETTGSNMVRTSQAFAEVVGLGSAVKGVELVTGYYAEQGQEGAYEQAMAIAVNSPKAVKALMLLFCGEYEQECVLVWNKDTDSVWLINESGFLAELGTKGMYRYQADMTNWVRPDACTVDSMGSIWEVR